MNGFDFRQLLLRLLQNLLLHPADLDEHLVALVEVCFFHLLSQFNVDSGPKVRRLLIVYADLCERDNYLAHTWSYQSSGLKQEALQETADECEQIYRSISSAAETETVVDHSWRCMHALARFPSASILKQVVSVILVCIIECNRTEDCITLHYKYTYMIQDVFDRFQRTYRNCANSSECTLSLLLVKVGPLRGPF